MSQIPQIKSRRTQDDWSQLMTEYEAGELTQRQFCERHQLAYSTFCVSAKDSASLPPKWHYAYFMFQGNKASILSSVSAAAMCCNT